ncbi:MAG: hypothetical protein KVP17_004670 [Porospora cf. gigantea B]|uniref:uncharacterized protein n=2 Tax=Porospora cf. gigantea B TaxID=2853592 RepID=UPI003571BD7C|nr:MAG: hypothetical protein KVP17_004670 [Porospora cf. gigantea B]
MDRSATPGTARHTYRAPLTQRDTYREQRSLIPEYDTTHLRNELSKQDFDLSLGFWTEPSRKEVWSLYQFVLHTLTGVEEDRIKFEHENRESLPQHVVGFNFHEAVTTLRMLRYSQRLSRWMHLPPTSLVDVQMPTRQSVYRFICAFVSFWSFMHETCSDCKDYFHMVAKNDEEVAALIERDVRADQERDDIEALAPAAERTVQQEQQLHGRHTAQMAEAHGNFQALTKHSEEIEGQCQQLRTAISDTDMHLTYLRSLIDDLELQIGASPATLKVELQEAGAALDNVEQALTENKADHVKGVLTEKALSRLQKRFEKACEFAEELGSQRALIERLQTDQAACVSRVKSLNADLDACESKLTLQNEARAQQQFAFTRIKAEYKQTQLTHMDICRAKQHQVNLLEDEIERKKAASRSISKDVSDIESEMLSSRTAFLQALGRLAQEYTAVAESVQKLKEAETKRVPSSLTTLRDLDEFLKDCGRGELLQRLQTSLSFAEELSDADASRSLHPDVDSRVPSLVKL